MGWKKETFTYSYIWNVTYKHYRPQIKGHNKAEIKALIMTD
jgi:hypothetical protein